MWVPLISTLDVLLNNIITNKTIVTNHNIAFNALVWLDSYIDQSEAVYNRTLIIPLFGTRTYSNNQILEQ